MDMIGNYQFLKFNEIDSTNEEAKRLVVGGKPEKSVILADLQSAGRGRLDRKWVSKPGNFYCSLLFYTKCDMKARPQISFVAAIAVKEAISDFFDGDIQLKWPNDVLADGKKIAGILSESLCDWMVVGVGVNLLNYPDNMRYPATCLQGFGVNVKVEELLKTFVKYFDLNMALLEKEGFEGIKKKWLESAYKLGCVVKINLNNSLLEGVFEGLSEGGEMILLVDGKSESVLSGDVMYSE